MARQSEDAKQLARAKWVSSGLTDEHARQMGLRALSAEDTAALATNFQAVVALLIPYWDLSGRPSKFFRVRYLAQLTGFAGVVAKPQRYAQPAGTLNEVYLAPLFKSKWKDIADNPEISVYVTEGELKSGSACAHGLATIGLGGVDVWRSSKRGMDLLPTLAAFEWNDREVTIVYDSDAATNENVVRAQRQLARELLNRGAKPRIASLPPGAAGEKQGLDDYLVANGVEALAELLAEAPPFGEAEALWALNEEVVYVKNPGLVVVRDTGQKMAPSAFAQHMYANRHYLEQKSTKKGPPKIERRPLAPRWITWERRFELERVTYAPGQPQLYGREWNTWPGWGVLPKRGNVTPWRWLLDYLFQGESVEVRRWFEQWCAYPIQHPGTKLFTSAVLWGVRHGTGKTLVAYTLMKIYGKNAVEIKDQDLRGSFNEWAENKQFIYGDEVTGNDGFVKRSDADRLKGMITQATLRVNAKYVPSYTVPDCCNYYFTSNHPDAFFLEDNDRRYFIHEVNQEPAAQKLYDAYDVWLHGDGPTALFHHLLNLSLEGFHPKAPALVTRSKQAMIRDNKSDLGLWVVGLREDPTGTLRPLGDAVSRNAELLTATQLLRAHDPEGSGRVKVNGLSRELKRAGFVQVNRGIPVRTQAAGLQRLYPVRNKEKWLVATTKELSAHFDELFLKQK